MGLNRAQSPFLQACRGEMPSHTPVWILRQAGRYLSEYRAVRSKFKSFLDFLDHPEAAAEVTLQPPALLGVDAAIVFSDILTILAPMGFDLAFLEGEGPRVANPLRQGDGRELPLFDPVAALPHVQAAVRLSRAGLPEHIPLIGFAGAPWTIACYLIDGGGSRDFARTRAWAHRDSASFQAHLERITDNTITHLVTQAKSGCDCLQIFESWGSLLSPADYRRLVLPSMQRLIAQTKTLSGVPVILYANGASTLLSVLREAGADVLAIDWRIEMNDARALVGNAPLQGNFDPCLLHAPASEIQARVKEVALQAQGGPWIANLGHGIQPDAPVQGLQTLIDAVHALPVPA